MRAEQWLPFPVEECVSLHYTEVPAQPWPALADRWLPLLPEGKRAAILRLREPADRSASLLGVALLAAALARRGAAFGACMLEYPARGKPRLRAGPDFSIAHDSGYVGCALATSGRVGFDLEARAAVRSEALRRVLGDAERGLVARGMLDAADAWVMTEAVLKAAGCGIAAAARVRLAAAAAMLDGAAFQLVRVAVASTHAAWLAHEGETLVVSTVRHGLDEFAPLP